MEAIERSYLRHKAGFDSSLTDEYDIRRAKTWFDKSTADYWRHARGYRIIEPLSRNASILTIGDGRWGLDSIRIKAKGFSNVTPSDIAPTLLKESKKRGFISDYKVLNAEKINLPSESYDYVFCKEAFHHFPRPYLALYEMIRVAKNAVILTEPNDNNESVVVGYEEVGNYTFLLSVREMIKISLAMFLPGVAFGGYNDYYIEGCEFEPADETKSEIFKRIRDNINTMDKLVMEGRLDYNMVSIIVFKKTPTMKEREDLISMGVKYIELPIRN